jgi:hypothetical protein
MSELFDKKGMMIVPAKEGAHLQPHDKLVALELYCPNKHNLITPRAMFGTHKGVELIVRQGGKEGKIAFSAVCNDFSRVTFDIELQDGEKVELFCCECREKIPVHSQCTCGGDLVAFFRTKECDFSEALGICDRVGCPNAHIIERDQLIQISRHNLL